MNNDLFYNEITNTMKAIYEKYTVDNNIDEIIARMPFGILGEMDDLRCFSQIYDDDFWEQYPKMVTAMQDHTLGNIVWDLLLKRDGNTDFTNGDEFYSFLDELEQKC